MSIEWRITRFCAHVRTRRLSLGLSYLELSEATGIPLDFLKDIEEDRLPPDFTLEQGDHLAQALHCQLSDLF